MQKLETWPWPTPEPGIYFNMSFEDYLSIPCMQSSGIKELCISDKVEDGAMDYWARSFMNPLCDEIDSDSQAKIDGRAYHKRILEGSTAFYAEYAPEYELNPLETILSTNNEMKAFLKENGVTGYSTKTAAELAILCEDVPDAPPTLYTLKRKHVSKYPEHEFVKAKTIREIELGAKMIECHPHLRTFFVGGYPEVTVIWDCPETGMRYKIRYDYLKVGPGCDLKTFANQQRKGLSKCIASQIATYKYYIQGTLYLNGRLEASKHVKAGKVFGAENVDPKWLEAMGNASSDEFWWVFQQKGIAPVAKGRIFSKRDPLYTTGMRDIERAVHTFIHNYNVFGEDCWIDQSKPEVVSSSDMPDYAYD